MFATRSTGGSRSSSRIASSRFRPRGSTRGSSILKLPEPANDASLDDPTKVIINDELKRYLVDETDMRVGVKIIQTEDYADF